MLLVPLVQSRVSESISYDTIVLLVPLVQSRVSESISYDTIVLLVPLVQSRVSEVPSQLAHQITPKVHTCRK